MKEQSWLSGSWIQTFTGRGVDPLDADVTDIVIEDIAHALSLQCRFGGHCERFYSVAEHCLLLSENVAQEHALWALLHDASEAYLVDLPRPVKRAIGDYRAIEDALMRVICARFGLPTDMPAQVRDADLRILTDEAQQLMKTPPRVWSTEATPLDVTIVGFPPRVAEQMFLDRFEALSWSRSHA